MARVTKKITVCDRDALGREKPATTSRRFSVEGTKYKLALCEEHARMFDRDMLGWSRLAAEEDAVPQTFGSKYTAEARRAAELRAKQAETQSCPAAASEDNNVHQLAPLISHRTVRLGQPLSAEQVERGQRYSNGWALTEHAKQRAEQRGYSIDEVLRAAASPVTSWDDIYHGESYRYHHAGECTAVVNIKEKLIITVLHKDRAKYLLDSHDHLTERVAR